MIDLKIAAVVTVYYPNEEVFENISSYSFQLDKVYLFDNSEQASFLKEKAGSQPNIIYLHTGENQGIAKVLNQAAFTAIKEGYEWLLMMDQDSKFSATALNEYVSVVSKYGNFEEVAMFGIDVNEESENVPAGSDPYFADHLITSGTLLNLSLFKKIGLFDENLFIDSVDHDYSIRVLQAGCKMVKFPGIHLSHRIGKMVKRSSFKTLFLVKKLKRIHSPLRCYYMYRNNLYMQEKHKNCEVRDMNEYDKTTKATIWRNFFYGGNMWSLLCHIFMARRDFRKKRMGKFAG